MSLPFFPTEASTSAQQVDALYLTLVAFSCLIMLGVFGPMIFFLFKYRKGSKADRTPIKVSTMKVEITWTVIPLILSLGLFAWGAKTYLDIEQPPPGALEIQVVGKQWMWKIQHQEGNREINELHVPLGRTIKVTLASQDVIHSFFLPAFRLKQDAVPGRYTTEWFKPTRAGTFHLFCAEYCGTGHSQMVGKLVVMRPEDYQHWLSTQITGVSLARQGAQLFRDLGCSGCHIGSKSIRCPPLEGIYGKAVPLESGQVVIANDQYIHDSILLPQSQIVAGYKPEMPSFDGHVTEEDVFKLVAYIKSLSQQQPVQTQVQQPSAEAAQQNVEQPE